MRFRLPTPGSRVPVFFRAALTGGIVSLLGVASIATEQGEPRGLYTIAQAERGEALYSARCASCHGALTDFAPGMAALLGDHTFRSSWTGRPLGELFGMIKETMPQDDPGTLSSDETADIVAYLLSGNRFPPGDSPLANDIDTLMEVPFDSGR